MAVVDRKPLRDRGTAESILKILSVRAAIEHAQANWQRERLLAHMEGDFDSDRYADVEEFILHNDGYSLEPRAAEILEGLGLLLLRLQGPERARQLLTDDRLGEEKTESYHSRLEAEAPAYLSGLVERETARMEKLSSAPSAKGGAVAPELVLESEALSADILRVISLYRATPAYSPPLYAA